MLTDILTSAFLVSLLAGAVRITAPILAAAIGELVSERAGVLNLSIEGTMTMGAFIGFLTTFHTGSLWLGVLAALLSGGLLSLLFAFLTVSLKIDQTVTGLTINLFASGAAFYLYRVAFPRIASENLPNIQIFERLRIPLLSDIPVLGNAFFSHTPITYLAFLLVPAIFYFLYRTNRGLELRCLGENPRVLDMKGINVIRYRYLAVIFGGMMSGFAGALLTLSSAGMFVPSIASGRGWIAVAIVIFGRWKPYTILLASFFFGFLDSLQLQIQGVGIQFPYQLLLALPYFLTIVALISGRRATGEPASLGVPYHRE
jgi:general nucleoside transport system permease protein